MQVVVNDILTSYQLEGTGKLVVFLHGWGDNSQGSRQLQQVLAKKYRVLAPDLPGFGKTATPAAAWKLDDYARWLQSLLRKLDLKDPFAIIGHSNGGAIAVRGIAMGVVRPERLILVAAAGIRGGLTARRAGLQAVAKVGKVTTAVLPARYRRRLRRKLYASAGSDMLVVESMQATFKNIVRQDVQDDARHITQPTLLVFAQDDTAVPPYMAKRYAELIRHSKLRMVADAGHFVYLDQPEQVAKLIKEFLV